LVSFRHIHCEIFVPFRHHTDEIWTLVFEVPYATSEFSDKLLEECAEYHDTRSTKRIGGVHGLFEQLCHIIISGREVFVIRDKTQVDVNDGDVVVS
jgi:hypothetical protein